MGACSDGDCVLYETDGEDDYEKEMCRPKTHDAGEKDLTDACVERVALERRLEGDDISGEQRMVVAVHLPDTDDAFALDDITDDETVVAAQAETVTVHTRALS